jgi:dihydroflavonol-4-reductase
MKIFITGATGFIGSHLVRRLAQTDHQLTCLVRKTSNTHLLDSLNTKLVTGDVTDKKSLHEGMRGCDWVFNLANLYSFWEPDKHQFTWINVHGTRTVMEAALEAGVSKVVHLSTALVFGKPLDYPFNEDSEIGSARFSEYAHTKHFGELLAWDLHKTKRLPLVVIYPGGVIGEGDTRITGQYLRDFIRQRLPATVFEDSKIVYVHVKDVVETILRASEKEGNIGEKYLVGKFPLSYREYNQMISEISGVPSPRFHLSGSMVSATAYLATFLANIIKKPPLWGMSIDSMKTMRSGFNFDGSKIERELGITYTPIREALNEEIYWLKTLVRK